MISKKELVNISAWANKVPYPGDDYAEETMEKLKLAEKLFRDIYENNKYNIILSNNEEIELEIKAKNLMHLLGIDYKNLLNDVFMEFRYNVLGMDPQEKPTSYQLLKAIIENSDKVIEYDKENFDKALKRYVALNYYRLSVKCDIFSKLGNLADFNFGVINFDKDKFLEKSGRDYFNARSTKYLYIPSDEPIAPYFLMGILPEENYPKYNEEGETLVSTQQDKEFDDIDAINRPYVVETTLAPDNIKPFFDDQKVVIPTYILKDSNKELNRIPARPSKKIALLKDYRSIVSTFEINDNIDIYSDYISSLLQEEQRIKKLTK